MGATMIFPNDVGKITPIHCPVCGEALIFEEFDRRRWYCQCGRYERIEMNEREPVGCRLASSGFYHNMP